MIKRSISIFILCIHTLIYPKAVVTAPNSSYYEKIQEIVQKYKRPITVLEIGRTSICYALRIASDFNAFCIALPAQESSAIAHTVRARGTQKVTVLNPGSLSHACLETLGRCEHFDVVIVHDNDKLFNEDFSESYTLCRELGDFVFIDIAHTLCKNHNVSIVARSKDRCLLMSHKPKESLDIARYTQYKRSHNYASPYRIKSTFEEKWFYKATLDTKVPWVPGINLITFVMLKGIYPTGSMIKDQFKAMEYRSPYHNDLVFGNVIVQGERLVPIDFDDKRRNASMKKCLRCAIQAFNAGKKRFHDPEKFIRDYYKTVKA
jgi:thiamine kinase-like enzyme